MQTVYDINLSADNTHMADRLNGLCLRLGRKIYCTQDDIP